LRKERGFSVLKFTYISAVLMAALLTSLILSAGARPKPSAASDGSHLPSTPYTKILPSSDAVFTRLPVPLDSLKHPATYYLLRRDLRRCAFPLCGGYFVRRVNHSVTRCLNGRLMAECYVAEIEWNANPQVEVQGALLRGNVARKAYAGFGNLGELRVTESWQAAGDKMPAGFFYRVNDRGVRCITHPCLTHQEARLNSTVQRNIAGVDLSGAGAPESKVSEAFAGMTQTDGVIVVGSHVRVTGPAGKSVTLKGTQFYLPAGKQVGSKTKKSCMRTGCSGQVCSDTEVITTCEWRPEYACYKGARCELQADGKCGFTRTAELTACLARPAE
jgi:hypothetical protein